MVNSQFVLKSNGRDLLCREVRPVPMRKRLSFQQKQRLKEERVKKIEISLAKSSEPQVGIEPVAIKNFRKYDCLNAIK